jgi:hypothetical protein
MLRKMLAEMLEMLLILGRRQVASTKTRDPAT